MTKYDFERMFWTQYLMLEQEFIESLIYVEFDIPNFKTYSIKFSKLLLQIGSEIDNVLKEVCNLQGRKKITDYAGYMLNQYPNIVTQDVIVKNKNITLTPFAGWNVSQASQSLPFWDSYNRVKHDRILNFSEASLEIVSNALAALFIIEMYQLYQLYIQDSNEFKSSPEKESQIFIINNWVEHIRTSKVKLEYSIIDDDDGSVIS